MDNEETMYLYSEDATGVHHRPPGDRSMCFTKNTNNNNSMVKNEQQHQHHFVVDNETKAEHLYNKRNKNFKNHILRKESWQDISSILNLSGKKFNFSLFFFFFFVVL